MTVLLQSFYFINLLIINYQIYTFITLPREDEIKKDEQVNFFKEFCDEATIKAYELAHELNLNVIDQIIPKKR